ncbi:MAG: hypothetical protein WD766_03020 [Gemmatimonadota bacterium]
MSVNGVGGIPATLLRPQESTRPRVEHERTPPPAPTPPPNVTRPSANGLLAPRQDALPAEAPAGTDPDLWQVLTVQERAYFAKLTAMGPLTYGSQARSAPAGETPLARGGRIDVRA